MASHVVVFTEPCGRVVVNIRNIEAPPRCPRLIFIKSDIVMFPTGHEHQSDLFFLNQSQKSLHLMGNLTDTLGSIY